MEYYSVIKKNETLPFKTAWIDLAGIMLSDMSVRESQTNATRFHLHLESKEQYKQQNRNRVIGTENRLMAARAERRLGEPHETGEGQNGEEQIGSYRIVLGNIVNNIMITMYGASWVLDISG